MTTPTVRLHRWDEIALEKVTEMISRKIVTGERLMSAQIYLKKGALVPTHSHESEQMTYVLQGALKFLINGEEITVREGEVLHIPSWVDIRPKRSTTPSSSTCSARSARTGWITRTPTSGVIGLRSSGQGSGSGAVRRSGDQGAARRFGGPDEP